MLNDNQTTNLSLMSCVKKGVVFLLNDNQITNLSLLSCGEGDRYFV